MAKKTQPCQEAQALLLFPLSRRLVANNNSRFFLKSCKRNKRKKAYVDVLNDLLSELPNEIALEILSRLPMKEVAKLRVSPRRAAKIRIPTKHPECWIIHRSFMHKSLARMELRISWKYVRAFNLFFEGYTLQERNKFVAKAAGMAMEEGIFFGF